MPGVWVEAVATGSAAAHTSAILVGDLLASIDGEPCVRWDYAQVAERLGQEQRSLELGLISARQLEATGVGGGAAAGVGAGPGVRRVQSIPRADVRAAPLFNDE